MKTKIIVLALVGLFISAVAFGQPAGGAKSTASVVSDPAWSFKFKAPAGWKYQKDANGAVLGHDTIPGVILVFPHSETGAQKLKEQMKQGLSEQDFQLLLQGALAPLGAAAVAGNYAGTYQGQPVKARSIGTFSASGGAYIVALSTPEGFSPGLAKAGEAIAQSMQFSKTEGGAGDAASALAGTWATMSASSTSQYTLAPNGTYSSYSESSYSGQFNNQYGDNTGAWGAGGQNSGQGRWTAQGSRERGTLILTGADGSVTRVPYQVHVEKGKVYWNEYLFDGTLYSR